VFSGDKTLVQFETGTESAIVDNSSSSSNSTSSGSSTTAISFTTRLWACAGTRTFTVRARDVWRWDDLPKVGEHRLGDRLAFELPEVGQR
jgi:hypothetical protein